MIRFGTCSWKYDSWKGIVYSGTNSKNYLQEYSKKFDTVEIDQWFWSLFSNSKIVLPQKKVVEEYKQSVPKDFLFTIKVPNSITLTHFYKESKEDELRINPSFLSVDLFNQFLETIEPIKDKIGCLIFQFEYLNKQKMKSLSEFQNKFSEFRSQIKNDSPPIGIEIRNPNYLNEKYFTFLSEQKIAPVLLEGYYMSPITETYSKFKKQFKNLMVIRLHGTDRKGIEEIANNNWSQIYINRDKEILSIAEMIRDLQKNEIDLFVNVNNHFEGSAPITINKIKEQLS
ncbi:MAG: DUF72 domain-containing protein [Ignavibacteriota bacterium]|nr:DUF72 domain-containing protein [Ignavibacteriales bacterium]MCC7095097.1 DUF72 domain-containing protein [Ignavibacteriaceae bacterium]MEB2295770.1 DUF72 domain-containing protein [Ignavibacteria bacterium]QKJ97642.1 MAG: DUF72 domain-containing protein [Ignavibacteriota bacterium]NUM61801.1 DUF72 domain-containing protein [Ignavibacteriaceae bacterium]